LPCAANATKDFTRVTNAAEGLGLTLLSKTEKLAPIAA
jgi:hypothetical protein